MLANISDTTQKTQNHPSLPILCSESIKNLPTTFITFPYLEISRLGDYTKFYLNAKWIAKTLNLPIAIRSFPQSHLLQINEKHAYALKESVRKDNFTKLTKQQCEDICNGKLTKESLGAGIFTVPFFWEWTPKFYLNDPEFYKEYIEDLSPISAIPLALPVENKVNIAMQIRDGGSFDSLCDKYLYPCRFPPIEYYEQQLLYVLDLPQYKGKPAHVQIFTDSTEPLKLKKHFENFIKTHGKEDLVTICFTHQNCSEDARVISDLISQSKFPIFIRANSGFSELAACTMH